MYFRVPETTFSSAEGPEAVHANHEREARRQRCSVAVAKLGRLSRDVHFIFRVYGAAGAVCPAPLQGACDAEHGINKPRNIKCRCTFDKKSCLQTKPFA
jgi:hypothetical protein